MLAVSHVGQHLLSLCQSLHALLQEHPDLCVRLCCLLFCARIQYEKGWTGSRKRTEKVQTSMKRSICRSVVRSQIGLTNSTKEFCEQFEGATRSLPSKTRVLIRKFIRTLGAKSLSHSFFVVPFSVPSAGPLQMRNRVWMSTTHVIFSALSGFPSCCPGPSGELRKGRPGPERPESVEGKARTPYLLHLLSSSPSYSCIASFKKTQDSWRLFD